MTKGEAAPTTGTASMPRPAPSGSRDSAFFWAGCKRGVLLGQRCGDCGQFHHPPKPVCPDCWSENLVPTEVEGKGTVHLAMHLHQGAPAPGVDYAKGPHPVVSVDLDGTNGVRFSSTVVDLPVQEVVIGLPVELDWIERYGHPFPVFRKREG